MNCLDSVANLARLVSHYKYRVGRQRAVAGRMSGLMNQVYQEILSCQQTGGEN